MIVKFKWISLSFIFIFFFSISSFSQVDLDYDELESDNEVSSDDFYKLSFFDLRGTNVFEIGGGASTLVGGVDETDYSYYFRLGYKRSVIDNLFLGLSYNNYNLAYNTIEQNLASLDFNIEYLVLPYDDFSPFIYTGFGYSFSNDTDANATKIQAGFGFEYIVAEKFGIRLQAEYNYSLDEDINFLIIDGRDDSFLKLGLGVNFYFGGDVEKEKRMENIPTKIKSNLIIPNN